MASQKRKLQTRRSRSERMQSATVKRARVAQSDGDALRNRRRGAEQFDPTPASSHMHTGFWRQALKEIGILAGIMVIMSLFLVVVLYREDQPVITQPTIDVLVVMAAATVVLSVLIFLWRWNRSRSAENSQTPPASHS